MKSSFLFPTDDQPKNESVQDDLTGISLPVVPLPDDLKVGIESLSGLNIDNVKMHRNADKPAQLNTSDFAKGTDIHSAAGQEKHLPHEAWHVLQQKRGRVKPVLQMNGPMAVNDSAGLEKEADVMGTKALFVGIESPGPDNVVQYPGEDAGSSARDPT